MPRHIALSEGAIRVQPLPDVDFAGDSATPNAAWLPVAATRLSSGGIAVADYVTKAVMFFDSTGSLKHNVGGPEGVARFENVAWIGQCRADSVFAWDAVQNVITVIDSSGKIAREFRPEGNPAMMACSREGIFVSFGMTRDLKIPDGSESRFVHYLGPLWLADSHGHRLKSFGSLPVGDLRPLGRLTRLALTPDRLFVGTADSASVDMYSLGGKRLATIPLMLPPRAPTQSNYESAIAMILGRFPRASGSVKRAFRRRLLAIPIPPELPPYADVLDDPAGVLWVVTSSPGDAATELRVVTQQGHLIGDILLPPDIRIFEVGRNYILAASTPSSGMVRVLLYSIRRSTWSASDSSEVSPTSAPSHLPVTEAVPGR